MPVHLRYLTLGVSKCEGLFVLFLLAMCCTAQSSRLVSSLVRMNQMKKNLHHWIPEDALRSCSAHQACKWYEITGIRRHRRSQRMISRVPLISRYLRGVKSIWAAIKASVGTMGVRKVILSTGSIANGNNGNNGNNNDDERSKDISDEINDDKMEI